MKAGIEEMATDLQFLFVYGTLMGSAASDYGRDMRERLHRELRSYGVATMQGRLYDLGSYPGLIGSADPGDLVQGEVVRLADPDAVFGWLDAYEGIVRGRADNEYERVLSPARLQGETLVSAHVYRYVQDVSAGRWLPEGRWFATT